MAAPIDRRLVRESRAVRPALARAGAIGVLDAVLIIAQAMLLASIVARAALEGAGVSQLRGALIALGAVLVARALAGAAFELSGRIGAIRVMSELRGRLVRHLLLVSPGQRPHDGRTGDLAAAAVQGVDALEAYFAGYLPQLVLASIVPVAILVWVATIDLAPAIILAVTVPILIAFMILIGLGATAATRRRWGALSLLSAHFLDVVQGLQTLRAHGRERAQEAQLADVGERYRRETMATLRVAFLSALVLELCAMIGTAIVAATIGVQLVGGHLSLRTGLAVLLLAPELYGPLRLVGQQFHAGAGAVAAAERIYTEIDRAPEVKAADDAADDDNATVAPDPALSPVLFTHVAYEYPGRPGEVLQSLDLALAPGELVALVGPSGSGKSTIARLLMRFADPTAGAISCGGCDLRELPVERWREQIAWVPQRASLFSGSVADNIRLGAPGASDEDLAAAVQAAGAGELVASLPDGLQTRIGDGGRRLSFGQRQRIALARAFLRDAPLLILDEPTAHLDASSAASIGDAIVRLARGRTTLLIVHHETLAARADRIVRIDSGRVSGDLPATAPETPEALETVEALEAAA